MTILEILAGVLIATACIGFYVFGMLCFGFVRGYGLMRSDNPSFRDEITLTLPWPPTVNTIWRRGGGNTYLSKGARRYYKATENSLLEQGLFNTYMPGRLEVEATFHFPSNDKRIKNSDLDNRIKAVLDALTKSHVWHDDDQVDKIVLVRGEPVPKGKVEVTIRAYREDNES